MSNEEFEPLETDFVETVPEPDDKQLANVSREERYFQLLVTALQACVNYKPMFGKGRKGGLTLADFQQLYGSDPFYHWIGLDSPRMYAAHKAAGGMTSIYRQLGIGGEWIFKHILRDSLNMTAEQITWFYQVPSTQGKTRTLTLDGRIQLDSIQNTMAKERVTRWLNDAKGKLLLSQEMNTHIKGAVFEVRQGYKRKDSKRQNADIANASNAYNEFYVPVLLLLSTQIDQDVASRYTQARWLLLNGTRVGNTTDSTYVFCREVLDYNLAGFFEAYSSRIKIELEKILATLLEA